VAARLADHGNDLLQEQRVPGGRAANPCSELSVEAAVCRQQFVDQCLGLVSVEWFEEDGRGVELAAAPSLAAIEELGPAETEHEDWGAATQIPDVLDEVEESRLAPVNVVEDDHERIAVRSTLEQLANGPRDLGR
jgi:hypothetical protein